MIDRNLKKNYPEPVDSEQEPDSELLISVVELLHKLH